MKVPRKKITVEMIAVEQLPGIVDQCDLKLKSSTLNGDKRKEIEVIRQQCIEIIEKDK